MDEKTVRMDLTAEELELIARALAVFETQDTARYLAQRMDLYRSLSAKIVAVFEGPLEK
jgi:hypothetical protein